MFSRAVVLLLLSAGFFISLGNLSYAGCKDLLTGTKESGEVDLETEPDLEDHLIDLTFTSANSTGVYFQGRAGELLKQQVEHIVYEGFSGSEDFGVLALRESPTKTQAAVAYLHLALASFFGDRYVDAVSLCWKGLQQDAGILALWPLSIESLLRTRDSKRVGLLWRWGFNSSVWVNPSLKKKISSNPQLQKTKTFLELMDQGATIDAAVKAALNPVN